MNSGILNWVRAWIIRNAAAIIFVALGVLGVSAVFFGWKASLVRNAQLDLRIEQKESQISNLKSQIASAESRADARERRVKELEAREEQLSALSRQLSAKLETAKREAKRREAELAALPAAQVHAQIEAEKIPAFAGMTEGQERAAAGIILARDNCREQLGLSEAQNENCEGRAANLKEQLEEQVKQISSFQFQVSTQAEVMRRQDELRKLEVTRARGAWWQRLGRNAKWFGLGVLAGGVAAGILAH